MNQNKLLLILCCLVIAISAQAQDSICDKKLKKAKEHILNPTPFVEYTDILALVEPCAEQGHAKSENFLGLLYLKGLGVDKDTAKAFSYISNAAHRGNAMAQCNLGRLYKYGIGCDINFEKAIAWFEASAKNGNHRAAYSLGYMYYKGFGVEQNYEKAADWFKQSKDPMGRHFLARSYYLGQGVEANTEKALKLLAKNTIFNNKTLAAYIKSQQEGGLGEEESTENQENETTENIVEELKTQDTPYLEPPTQEDLITQWTGKLIQYDWSGKHIERILPIELDISNQGDNLKAVCHLAGQQKESDVLWQDETLYIENMTFTLDRLYSAHPKKLAIDYTLLSANLKQQYYNGVNYLTGSVDTYIDKATEYGEPMSIVLYPKDGENAVDETVLTALAKQEDQFIKLYPVPFKDQLLIKYHLETHAPVTVFLTSFDAAKQVVIEPGQTQAPGDHSYHISPDLQAGLYIVSVQAGNQVFTRLVVKEN